MRSILVLLAALFLASPLARSQQNIKDPYTGTTEPKKIGNRNVAISFTTRGSELLIRVAVWYMGRGQSIRYDQVTLKAKDADGKPLVIRKEFGDKMTVYINGTTGATTASGFYAVPLIEGHPPATVEFSMEQQTVVFKLSP